ncbi:MFS drug efflux transporter [Ophiocordyceps sinensis CO18]|uniref:MFS drug efflux transporter n=1 Tax=Ophiocordyceps sinensis (strain Co18 / CGMCC 3.14243) TaxID=911162 RepID=T5A5X6_OPHSC|nr:MFS drug efflux transporter [Ophiocordyceps sinensis CO18]
MSRWGYYKPWYVGGSAAALITGALMAHYVDLDTSPGIFYVVEFFLGAGAGAYTQSSFAVIQSVLPPSEGANGLALMLVAQLGGMTLGLSISGAVFINKTKKGLYEVLPHMASDQIDRLAAGASGGVLQSLSSELRRRTLEVIVSSWQSAFICVYVGAAASLAVSLFLRNGRANIPAAAGGG